MAENIKADGTNDFDGDQTGRDRPRSFHGLRRLIDRENTGPRTTSNKRRDESRPRRLH